ncbi:Cupredoxin [Lipomyces arxii]|uniref:Cupredoxin n=1 Tax=Lipomyces arxii TaxID=56418 RepID=UPI0034CEF694
MSAREERRYEKLKKSANVETAFGKLSRWRDWILVGVAVLVIAAIALGMGIGLRRYQNSSNGLGSPTGGSTWNDDWRLNTGTEYRVSKNWNSSAPLTTRVYNFTVSEVSGWPDGYNRSLTVVNGKFPGPLIEANMGDRLVVNVVNQGLNPTTIHFHGLYQNSTNFMDGVTAITQCAIPPGGSFTYNFTLENQYGTYWYHSHYGTQYMDGVVGPLVIHSQEEDDLIGHMYDYDQVVLISDWYHNVAETYLPEYLAPGNENVEPVPDNGLINGGAHFDCSKTSDAVCFQNDSSRTVFNLERDSIYRFRVINTGAFAEIDFSIDDHEMTLIEGDGTLIAPTMLHKIRVAVAQRYSILIKTNVLTTDAPSEIFWMRAELNQFCFAETNPVLNPGVTAAVVYTNVTDSRAASVMHSKSATINTVSNSWDDVSANVRCRDLNNTSIEPMIAMSAPNATAFYRLDSSFQIKARALDLAYINGTTWRPASQALLYQAYSMFSDANSSAIAENNSTQLLNTVGVLNQGVYDGDRHQYIIRPPDYAVVDVLINNLDDGSHPFHLHGYKFWVMGAGTGNFQFNQYQHLNATNPMRRDTVQVQGYGWTIIRFVADNPGLWAFHCHITWHLEAGLLMQFQVLPSKIAQLEPPNTWAQLCTV